MAENSKIEWTDHTFNPWVGCQKVSPGCDRCYAEEWARRFGLVQWGPHAGRRRTSAGNWRQPLKWAREAQKQLDLYNEGMLTLKPARPRVFCASLADVFDNQVPEEWRRDLFDTIGATPELDWLLLTKRPENILKFIPRFWHAGLPSHIWVGTTAEDQERYNRRMRILADVPASVHFVSYEPAIGPLVMRDGYGLYPSWLICGGESGHGARQMDLQWARDIRDECRRNGVRFFFKQTTGKAPIPDDLMVREFPR
jgi:protein gp37